MIDLVGKTFGRLTVIEKTELRQNKSIIWKCKCSCGTIVNKNGSGLRYGQTRSCGCFQTEYRFTHRKSDTKVYAVWANMIQRCTNKKNTSYMNYGARGITVCERWFIFEHFYSDMGDPPSPKHMIERVDNDKGYSAENCKWANRYEQNQNTRAKGYWWSKQHKKYRAQVRVNGALHEVGLFSTEKEAHEQYLRAKIMYQKIR